MNELAKIGVGASICGAGVVLTSIGLNEFSLSIINAKPFQSKIFPDKEPTKPNYAEAIAHGLTAVGCSGAGVAGVLLGGTIVIDTVMKNDILRSS